MTAAVGLGGYSRRRRTSLSRRRDVAFNLITTGICATCVLLSLDARRSALERTPRPRARAATALA
jgi:hypothetical protein